MLLDRKAPDARPAAHSPTRTDNIRIGIAGWSYPDWNGSVYPPGTRDTLAYAAKFVDVIEVNASFYRVPTRKTVASWQQRTAQFPIHFTAKLHQDVTHCGRCLAADAERFRDSFRPLTEAGRLSHLLAQFRYDFQDTAESRILLQRIRDKYGGIAPTLVLELRHKSWQTSEALSWLNHLQVTVANLDYPTAADSFNMRTCNVGEHAYLRLHGRNTQAWFSKAAGRDETYNYRYNKRELTEITERTIEIAAMSKSLTLIANNHFRGKEMANALEIKNMVTGEQVDVPRALLHQYPDLARIAKHRHDIDELL